MASSIWYANRWPSDLRNNRLNKSAFILGGKAVSGLITEDEALNALWAACLSNGYIDSRDPSDGPRSFKKTFRRSWREGRRKPLPGPRERCDAGPEFEINLKVKA